MLVYMPRETNLKTKPGVRRHHIVETLDYFLRPHGCCGSDRGLKWNVERTVSEQVGVSGAPWQQSTWVGQSSRDLTQEHPGHVSVKRVHVG